MSKLKNYYHCDDDSLVLAPQRALQLEGRI
jgi:hypothetical protein